MTRSEAAADREVAGPLPPVSMQVFTSDGVRALRMHWSNLCAIVRTCRRWR
jgi:hypothetical protein